MQVVEPGLDEIQKPAQLFDLLRVRQLYRCIQCPARSM
jgi:hypothetical protein